MTQVRSRLRVLHHVGVWLRPSETFVAGLVGSSRHRAFVVAANGVEGTDRFPPPPLTALPPIARVVRRGLRTTPERAERTALRTIVLGRRADVVHVHFGYRLASVVGATGRAPVVVSLYGHDATAFVAERPDRFRALASRVAAVLVPSDFLADKAVAAGFAEEAIHVAPPGTDLQRFRASPLDLASRDVVFAGRLVEKKGIDVLLAAWPHVRAIVPDATLHVVGDGPLADAVADERPGLVFHRGMAPPEFVAERLRAARVVVTPSRTGPDGDTESQLLVNIEAQAMSRPVVTTRHGGVAEFVDAGRSALVVPENDPGELADALIRVLTDDALAASMAAAGPAVAARFGLEPCTARIDAIYDSVVASG